MEGLERADLDKFGKPVLFGTEKEIYQHSKSFLCVPTARDSHDSHKNARMVVTSHRLVYINGTDARSIDLSQVKSIEPKTVRKLLKVETTISLSLHDGKTFQIRFKDKDTLSSYINTAMSQHAWGTTAATTTTATTKTSIGVPKSTATSSNSMTSSHDQGFSVTSAGIGGLIRREEEKMKQADESLNSGFKDIDALMGKAEELVALADKIKAAMAKEAAASGGEAQSNDEFDGYLAQMGIAAPVTKSSAGSKFHTELAKQLADFCVRVMKKTGPMITLPDLYCLFNRARGTDLVSPDDLHRACELLEPMALPVRLKKFPSGVLVVRLAEYDEKTISKQIADLIVENGPLSALEIARINNVSLALANEQVSVAEHLELICRDETFEGVTFYLNFFPEEVEKLPPRN